MPRRVVVRPALGLVPLATGGTNPGHHGPEEDEQAGDRQERVRELTFGAEGEWLTVQTAKPDELYGSLAGAAEEAGVTEMYSPDENLESVFRYLVAG